MTSFDRPWTSIALSAALTLAVGCATDEPVPGDDNNANNTTGSNNTTSGSNNTTGANNTNNTSGETNNSNNQTGVAITAVSPTSGPLAGGTEVTINGANFGATAAVTFGGVAATSVDARSPSQLLVVTPPGANPGGVDVTVTVGGDSATRVGGFTYDEPPATARYCKLQAQSPASAIVGEPSNALYALVFALGVTEGAGEGASITAEVGYGAGDDATAFAYSAASYNIDVDGLTPGDLANDEWGAPLTVADAGTYKYAMRFKVEDDTEWTYCDLDGSDNGTSAEQLGVLEVTDAPTAEVGYCVTQTATAQAAPGQASSPIVGAVFVAGGTELTGQGAQILAELVWGDPTEDTSAWTSVTAAYLDDEGNNDRYSATITTPNAGDYAYAMRFSADGGATWSLCDTDGTSYDNSESFEPAKVGALEVAAPSANLPDSCSTQFPTHSSDALVGTPERYFMRLTEAGVTDSGDDGADVRVEAFWGPNGQDPIANPGAFTSIAASFNSTDGPTGASPDEYEVSWSAGAEGSYAIYWRASVDSGANWSWCDLDAADPFDPTAVTVVDAFASTPAAVDYCHVFDAAMTKSLADPSEPIYVGEVYDDAVTDGTSNGSNANQLEVEFGHGPLGANPAYAGAYTWATAAFGRQLVNNNNYEFDGTPYPAGSPPALAAGAASTTYGVAMRVRVLGPTTAWTYCDTNNTNGALSFDLDALSTLEILP